jgi:hypothetical protein
MHHVGVGAVAEVEDGREVVHEVVATAAAAVQTVRVLEEQRRRRAHDTDVRRPQQQHQRVDHVRLQEGQHVALGAFGN